MHKSSNGTISQFELFAVARAEKQRCNTSTMSNANLMREDDKSMLADSDASRGVATKRGQVLVTF